MKYNYINPTFYMVLMRENYFVSRFSDKEILVARSHVFSIFHFIVDVRKSIDAAKKL